MYSGPFSILPCVMIIYVYITSSVLDASRQARISAIPLILLTAPTNALHMENPQQNVS